MDECRHFKFSLNVATCVAACHSGPPDHAGWAWTIIHGNIPWLSQKTVIYLRTVPLLFSCHWLIKQASKKGNGHYGGYNNMTHPDWIHYFTRNCGKNTLINFLAKPPATYTFSAPDRRARTRNLAEHSTLSDYLDTLFNIWLTRLACDLVFYVNKAKVSFFTPIIS